MLRKAGKFSKLGKKDCNKDSWNTNGLRKSQPRVSVNNNIILHQPKITGCYKKRLYTEVYWPNKIPGFLALFSEKLALNESGKIKTCNL